MLAIDCSDPSWAVQASRTLQQHRYARLRLPTNEIEMLCSMYTSTWEALVDDDSCQQLRFADHMENDLDGRTGYHPSRNREYLELHPATPAEFDAPVTTPAATRALESASRVASACRARCEQVLQELARSDGCSALGPVLEQEARESPPAAGAVEKAPGYSESMLRIYRYSRRFELSKGDAHHDMGLLTLIPRASSPGLQIRPDPEKPWITIEQSLGEDEAILFGGMCLARLTGLPALLHRVEAGGKVRMSAPYFLRPSPRVLLPASAAHPAEYVYEYNARTSAAHNDELTALGEVRVDPSEARDYDRRLARERRALDRLARRKRRREGDEEASAEGDGELPTVAKRGGREQPSPPPDVSPEASPPPPTP